MDENARHTGAFSKNKGNSEIRCRLQKPVGHDQLVHRSETQQAQSKANCQTAFLGKHFQKIVVFTAFSSFFRIYMVLLYSATRFAIKKNKSRSNKERKAFRFARMLRIQNKISLSPASVTRNIETSSGDKHLSFYGKCFFMFFTIVCSYLLRLIVK